MSVLKTLLDIVYPHLCRHCDTSLETGKNLFCSACLEHLCLIDCQERCPRCFAEAEKKCSRCLQRSVVIKRQAAACTNQGAARTLLSYLKRENTQFLQAISSLMALQWATLEWPLPDIIVALPSSFWTRFKKAEDINISLGKEMSHLLERPFVRALRSSFDREAFFQRAEVCSRYFFLEKRREEVCDKRVLLIALQLEDSKLRQAAEVLQEGFALEIYALAFTVDPYERH